MTDALVRSQPSYGFFDQTSKKYIYFDSLISAVEVNDQHFIGSLLVYIEQLLEGNSLKHVDGPKINFNGTECYWITYCFPATSEIRGTMLTLIRCICPYKIMDTVIKVTHDQKQSATPATLVRLYIQVRRSSSPVSLHDEEIMLIRYTLQNSASFDRFFADRNEIMQKNSPVPPSKKRKFESVP